MNTTENKEGKNQRYLDDMLQTRSDNRGGRPQVLRSLIMALLCPNQNQRYDVRSV